MIIEGLRIMENQKNYVESLLLHGEQNALSTRELLAITDFRTARELQKQIAWEREAGAQILSSHRGGYFLPDASPAIARSEVNTFVRTLQNRARSTYRVARLVQKSAATTPPGQLSFFNNVSGEV